MAFKIQPSQLSGSAGLVPSVMNLPVEATQVFEKGTPVTLVSGEIEEHPLGATVIDLISLSRRLTRRQLRRLTEILHSFRRLGTVRLLRRI
jgi:hypothetical protein